MSKNTLICIDCRRPLSQEDIKFWADNDANCRECMYADHAAESAALAYAENGGGSEMLNDVWANAEKT